MVRKGASGHVAYGLWKGHKTTGIKQDKKKTVAKKAKFVRDIVRDVAGLSPYEKRCVELLRISADKRALKFVKKRLGTMSRARVKREEMSQYLAAQRRAAKKA